MLYDLGTPLPDIGIVIRQKNDCSIGVCTGATGCALVAPERIE